MALPPPTRRRCSRHYTIHIGYINAGPNGAPLARVGPLHKYEEEKMRAIDLLLVAAMSIIFFLGFVVGFVLPPNVTARIERVGEGGEVQIQHLRIRPTPPWPHRSDPMRTRPRSGSPRAEQIGYVAQGHPEVFDVV